MLHTSLLAWLWLVSLFTKFLTALGCLPAAVGLELQDGEDLYRFTGPQLRVIAKLLKRVVSHYLVSRFHLCQWGVQSPHPRLPVHTRSLSNCHSRPGREGGNHAAYHTAYFSPYLEKRHAAQGCQGRGYCV